MYGRKKYTVKKSSIKRKIKKTSEMNRKKKRKMEQRLTQNCIFKGKKEIIIQEVKGDFKLYLVYLNIERKKMQSKYARILTLIC
jgi:hypothetical protein